MEERIVDPIPCNKSWNDRFLGGQRMWLFQLSYAGQGHMEGCLWSLIDWLRIDSSACLYQSLPWEGQLQHLSRPEMRSGDTYSFATPLPHTLVPPPALYQQNAACFAIVTDAILSSAHPFQMPQKIFLLLYQWGLVRSSLDKQSLFGGGEIPLFFHKYFHIFHCLC